ncbi:MAG: zinc ribbon domain-containing protein [Clostridia bacterium]|nr:zinc ribbon domain-containing protein [Clostridia bacterium]
MAFCRNCGTQYIDGSVVCPRCGAPTGVQQPPMPYMPYVKPKVPGKGFGITAMVLGIIGLFYGMYLLFATIVAAEAYSSYSYYGGYYSYGAAGVLSSALVVTVVIFSSLSIMAIAFGSAAKNRGYRNGVSTSGVVMGVIGLIAYLIAILVAATI